MEAAGGGRLWKADLNRFFAIKCLTLHGGNDVRPEVRAVIGAND